MNAGIRKLDLNLLKALDALLDERSVTRAADRLALTQPAVSGMLNRLRESFDDPLLVRAQRGLVPTLRAEHLAGPIKRLLAEVQDMLQPQIFDPAQAALTLRLAATDYAQRAIVVPFLSALRTRAPHVRVSVQAVDSQQLASRLDNGSIDLAFVTPQSAPSGLHSAALFNERYVCAMRTDHPDARLATISLDRFCALGHVLVSPDQGGFRGATDEALQLVGRVRNVVTSVTSFLVMPDLLMTSDLIAVVPSRLVAGWPGLRVIAAPLAIQGFTKSMVWHERTHRDPAQTWLGALVSEVCVTER